MLQPTLPEKLDCKPLKEGLDRLALAAQFYAILDAQVEKTLRIAKRTGISNFVLTGDLISQSHLFKNSIERLAKEISIELVVIKEPSPARCEGKRQLSDVLGLVEYLEKRDQLPYNYGIANYPV